MSNRLPRAFFVHQTSRCKRDPVYVVLVQNTLITNFLKPHLTTFVNMRRVSCLRFKSMNWLHCNYGLFCKKVTFITSTRRAGGAPRTSAAPGTWTGRYAASASRRTGCGRGAGRTHPCMPADPQQAAPPPRSLCPENTPKYMQLIYKHI